MGRKELGLWVGADGSGGSDLGGILPCSRTTRIPFEMAVNTRLVSIRLQSVYIYFTAPHSRSWRPHGHDQFGCFILPELSASGKHLGYSHSLPTRRLFPLYHPPTNSSAFHLELRPPSVNHAKVCAQTFAHIGCRDPRTQVGGLDV